MSLQTKSAKVTISNGTALSPATYLGDAVLSAIIIPAAWTAAALTFQVSDDLGVTWNELQDDAGNIYTIASPAASNRYEVDATTFKSSQFLKVRSGTSVSPVNQGADRILTLVRRKFYPVE